MTSKQRGLLLPPGALALTAGVFLGRSTPAVVYALAACVLCVPAVLLLRGRLRFAACLAFFLALGTFSGSLAFHPSLPEEGECEVRAFVSDEITRGNFSQVRIPLSGVTVNGRPVSGGAYWTFYADEVPNELAPGKEAVFHTFLYHPDGASNPGGYDFRESLLQRGITVCLYGCEDLSVRDPEGFTPAAWIASLRHRLSLSLVRVLGEETGSYASALLLGRRSGIPSEDRRSFARLGIAHILAVSGFHVGILVWVLALLFRLLRLRPRVRLILYAVLLFFYAALCGMSPPVVRASLFLLLAYGGRILNRPRSGLHLLSAACFIMVLISPVQVPSASFLLTFCAMLGLIWFTPLCTQLNPFRNRILSGMFRSLLLTFGIQLCILVPELYFFQRLPLLSFLLNWPAVLIASVLILLFWFTAALLPVPGAAALLSGPLTLLTGKFLEGVRALGSLPGTTLWLPSPNWLSVPGVLLLLAGFCGFVKLRFRFRALLAAAGAAVLSFSLIPAPHDGTEYIQFSAGNADAAVIWDRDQVLVMDTGEEDGILSGFLRSRRLTPDAVILTHLHTDHAGGLRSMIQDEIPVPLLYLPAGAEGQQVHPDLLAMVEELRASGTEVRWLSRGDVLPLPSGNLTVLWPESGRIRPRQDANRYSLVSLLSLKGTSLLLAADIPGLYEDYAAVPADILKAAHHGSSSSTSGEFLSAVSPRLILLSCARLSRLQSFRERVGGIPVFGTPESGAVTVRFVEGGFTVLPFLNP